MTTAIFHQSWNADQEAILDLLGVDLDVEHVLLFLASAEQHEGALSNVLVTKVKILQESLKESHGLMKWLVEHGGPGREGKWYKVYVDRIFDRGCEKW